MKIVLLGLWLLLHDFHTSITEINYNASSNSLELSVRVFRDDLEKALTKLNSNQLVKIDDAKADDLIQTYIRKNLALIGPNKEVKFGKYYGKENEADAVWLYFEIFECSNLKNYSIFNAILTDLFEDQTNLVNIQILEKKKTLVFNSKEKIAPLTF